MAVRTIGCTRIRSISSSDEYSVMLHHVGIIQSLTPAGGPSINWKAAGNAQPESFAIRVSNDARGIENTWPLSAICQQDVQIYGNYSTQNALFTEPPQSCM